MFNQSVRVLSILYGAMSRVVSVLLGMCGTLT